MLNIVWPIFILISVVYTFLTGNFKNLNNSIFESTSTTVNLCLTLLGTMTLWSGLMKIASETSIVEKITKVLNPVINFLFPDIKNNKKLHDEICMNIVANILGLGNAATPLRNKSYENYAKK